MIAPPEPIDDTCPNCAQPAMGAYCSGCGEKRRDRSDWKLSNIAGETVAELTNVEHSKLWQTLRLLVFRPGQLTCEYWSGRRKRFLGPVKLYLVFFALALVLYSIHKPTAVYDVRTLAAADSDGKLPRLLDQVATERGVPVAQLSQELNARWQSYISMSQVFYPLFVALVLKLLLHRRRLYFAEHLIFALHVLAFMFLSFAVTWPLFVLFGIQSSLEEYTLAFLMLAVASFAWMGIYLVLAMRRAYAEGWLAAISKSFLVFTTYLVTSMAFMSATLALAIAITRRAG